jgi:hypothetical protein
MQEVRGWSGAALAVAGPLGMGAALGLSFGVEQAIEGAFYFPLIVVGVSALMTPALYIAGSLLASVPRLDVGAWLQAPYGPGMRPATEEGDSAPAAPRVVVPSGWVAPSASEAVVRVGRSLSACGVCLLGLLPLALFLFSTANQARVQLFLGMLGLASGVLTGLVVLYREFFRGAPSRWLHGAVFLAWSLVSLGIGLKFFVDATQPFLSLPY